MEVSFKRRKRIIKALPGDAAMVPKTKMTPSFQCCLKPFLYSRMALMPSVNSLGTSGASGNSASTGAIGESGEFA